MSTATTGLVLVDIQNDYFRGGAMELVEMERAADTAAGLLGAFRDAGRPVYFVQHLAIQPGASFFVPETPGVEIHESIAPRDGESLTQKHFPNSFRDTDLAERLRGDGVSDLVIVGAMSHMCIDATTRAAFDLGFTCSVASDACATRDLVFDDRTLPAAEVHAAFMAALSAPYAKVTAAKELRPG